MGKQASAMGKGAQGKNVSTNINGVKVPQMGKPSKGMSLTIPKTSTPQVPITKKSLKDCIPKHCFKRSYAKSFGHLGWDIFMVIVAASAVLYAREVLASPWMVLVWPMYWWYQGLTGTGIWVIAHECGHGGFSDSQQVNDFVGFFLHSFLLTPYFSWKYTHAKHHHYTNHISEGETWVPSTAKSSRKQVKFLKSHAGAIFRIVMVATIGWYAYLFNNNTGARNQKGQSHFNPRSTLFKKDQRPWIVVSAIGFWSMAAALAYACYIFGGWNVFALYFVPQMIVNHYLTSITFMQHTHPEVPHFQKDEWTWLRGALSTVDRSMGAFVDAKLHHIVDSHVVHHTFSDMPFYGAKEATPYVAAHLGDYYKSVQTGYFGYWHDYYWCAKESLVVKENPDDHFWYFD